jgi:hypothetical protein
MKRPTVLFALILLVSIGIEARGVDALSPFGSWIQHDRFGAVWAPRHLDPEWRPYTRGHWSSTESDRSWVSDEDSGWTADHYGRWHFDTAQGWFWIPGEEWAPTWAAWPRASACAEPGC